MRQGGLINAFYLKMAMLVLMVFDHLYLYLFPRELLSTHYIARIVAPVFVFLMAQGMVFTRDRIRYIMRLLSFGALMALVNYTLELITGIKIYNNIFLSMGVAATLIFSIDKARENASGGQGKSPFLWILPALAAFFASSFCEGGYSVAYMAVIFYYLRNNRTWMYTVFILVFGLPFVMVYIMSGELPAQFYMIAAVFPIMLYNGERGPDTPFAKYFFYFFYPLHVWVIVLIRFFMF